MSLVIALSSLRSRITRSEILREGLRKIDLNFNLSGEGTGGTEQEGGGLLNRFFNFGRRLVGFITNRILPLLQISFTSVFGWLVSRWQQIYTFNWNATDAEIRASFQNQNLAVAAAWGGALGSAFGWTVGIAIGGGVSLICPVIGGAALAKYVAGQALPEALEEVGENFGNAIRVTVGSFASRGVSSAFMQYRRVLKRLPRSVLVALYGADQADFIKEQWGNEGQPNISFAQQAEERLERLPPVQAAFWEEFWDEAWDGFTEAGYIIAAELDAAVASAKAGAQNVLGSERTVTVQPDNRTNETFAFTGKETVIQQSIQTNINQFRVIHNRDVGQIVGQPAEDWYKAKPQRRKLTIVFRSVEKPPFMLANGDTAKSATYAIPEPKPGLSWQQIKRAAKQYTWGKFRCTANLTNGRQMAVYGYTAQEAEEKLRELMILSTCEISTISVTEEKDRNPRLRKDPTLMFPSTGCLLVRRDSVDATGRTDLEGNTLSEENIRFDLWCDEEPEEFLGIL